MSNAALQIVPNGVENPQLPAARESVNSAGKMTGYVQHFSGKMAAKDVKEALKANGIKGKELTKRVNETLRGEKDLRQQLGMAWLQAQYQAGYVPDMGKTNKAQDKCSIVLIKAAPKVEVSKEQVDAMTKEERAALIALLTA
jgi:hypothetical protein